MNSFTKILFGVGGAGILAVGLTDMGEPAEMPSAPAEVRQVQEERVAPEASDTWNLPVVEAESVAAATPIEKEENNCHPSYSDCLNPNASDYDCEGGSGNGPHYTGAVRVMGPDVFDLDRDNDGWGCE